MRWWQQPGQSLNFPAPVQPTSIATVQTSPAVPTEPPRRRAWPARSLGFLPLLVALGAATVMYWPSLGSGFWNDDYIYLVASRTIPLGRFVHESMVPNSTDPNLHFVQAFWRPLYFISFRGLHGLFGTHLLGYHLMVFAIHLATIAVIWALSWRLTRSLAGAGVAAIVFAVFPLGYDSVAWVSSLNSAAFPLALGSWLVFTFAVDERPSGQRIWLHAAALLLLTAALGFRENTLSIVGAIGLWFVLCRTEPHALLGWRTWLPLVPYAVLSVVYLAFRTFASTQWVTPDPVFSLGWMNVRETWYYIKLAPLPFLELGGGWPETARKVASILFLLLIPLSLVLRRWLTAVLLASFVLTVIPYSIVIGVTPRYMYFPAAFLALAAAALVADGRRLLEPRTSRSANVLRRAGYAGLLIVIAAGGMWLGNRRVQAWVDVNPTAEQLWIQDLRQQFPVLPPGTTLWVAGTPIALTLFNAVSLKATVRLYYPGVTLVPFSVISGAAGPQPPPGAVVYIHKAPGSD